jgi:hypothetical protein
VLFRWRSPMTVSIQASSLAPQPSLFPDVLTLEETAIYLRLEVAIVQRQAEQGKLPGRRIEGIWRFLKSAIDRWLQGSGAEPMLVSSAASQELQSGKEVLLQQFGVFAEDETLPLMLENVYAERGRPETEEHDGSPLSGVDRG